jgi:hypothetical protein
LFPRLRPPPPPHAPSHRPVWDERAAPMGTLCHVVCVTPVSTYECVCACARVCVSPHGCACIPLQALWVKVFAPKPNHTRPMSACRLALLRPASLMARFVLFCCGVGAGPRDPPPPHHPQGRTQAAELRMPHPPPPTETVSNTHTHTLKNRCTGLRSIIPGVCAAYRYRA